MTIQKKRILFVVIGVILLIIGWALFRPELLFVNKHVDEPFPDAPDTTTSAPSSTHAPAKPGEGDHGTMTRDH